VRMPEQVPGEVEGERRLADALRAGEKQGVRQLAGAVRRGQHRRRAGMAEQPGIFRRLGNVVQRVVLLRRDPLEHQRASARSRAKWWASTSNTASVTTSSTLSASAEASMTMQRLGSRSAMAR